MDRSKNSNQKRKNAPQVSRTVKRSRQEKKPTQTRRTCSSAPETGNLETADLSVDMTESTKESGSSGTSIMCTICMDTLSVDDLQDHMEDNDEVDLTEGQEMDLQPTFCGHVFHSLCLKRWLKVEPFCPICRDPVNPDPFLLPDRIQVHAHSAEPETGNPETSELPVDMTESPKKGASSKSVVCTICMDTLSLEDLRDHIQDNDDDGLEWQVMDLQPTFCGHVFHSLCLKRWLKVEPFCPVCRDPVNPDPFLLPGRIPVHARPAAPGTVNLETAGLSVDMTESRRTGGSSTSVLCTICMDTLSVDDLQDHIEDKDDDGMEWQVMDLQPTFCGHVFHSLCLKRWLKVEPFCPVCRDPVNPDPFLLPDIIPVHARSAEPESGNSKTAELGVDMTESRRTGSSATSILCAICVDNMRSVDDLQDHMADNDEDWSEWQDMGLQPTFCGHVFHSLCLDRWLQLDPFCPVCRDPVNPDPFLLPDRIPGK